MVFPNDGKLVRDPLSRLPIPPEGKEVSNSTFWRRRIAAHDVAVRQVAPLFVAEKAQQTTPVAAIEEPEFKLNKKSKK